MRKHDADGHCIECEDCRARTLDEFESSRIAAQYWNRRVTRLTGDMIVIPTKEQVRSARDAAGLTQAQAARLVYVTSHAWHYWEAGKRAMPAGLWELFNIKTEVHHD